MNLHPDRGHGQFLKNVVIVASAVALGLVFQYLFFGKAPGISVPIFATLGVTCLFVVLQAFGREPKWSQYWLALPLLGFSVMIALRANVEMQLLNLAVSYGLFLLLVSAASGRDVHKHSLKGYVRLAAGTFDFLFESSKTLTALRTHGADQAHRKAIGQILRGAFAAIPLLVVFLVLFSSADLAFGRMMQKFLEALSIEEVIFRAVMAAVVALFFVGALAGAAGSERWPAERAATGEPKRDDGLAIATVLALLNLLFLAFVIFQIKYLFGGAEHIERLGFTYADYARKGFFELLAVTAVSFVALLGMDHLAGKDGRRPLAFKLLSVPHVLLVLAIVASAHQRLSIYEQAYGFTTQRFFSHAFVFLLASVFLALLYKIVRDGRDDALAFHMLLLTLAFGGTLNVLNPDRFVVERNLERFRETQKIDVPYVASLSSDAVPAALELLDPSSNAEFKQQYEERMRPRIESFKVTTWPSFNLSKARAAELLQARLGNGNK